MTSAVASRTASVTGRVSLFAQDATQPPPRTLEQTVLAALDERRLRGSTACLICGSPAADATPCPSCGSELN